MQPASRRRRRILAAVFIAGGVLILCVAPSEYLSAGMRWKGLLVAPAFVLLGLTGLIYPRAIPDPRPSAGAVGAVAEAGSPGLVVGGIAFFTGLAVGIWLAFIR
jgi:hypothetical protein